MVFPIELSIFLIIGDVSVLLVLVCLVESGRKHLDRERGRWGGGGGDMFLFLIGIAGG